MWPQLQPGGRGAPCHSPSSPLLRREGPGVFLQASFPDPNPLWPRVVARGGVCIPWASGDAQPVLPPSSLRSSFLGLGPGPLHSLCRSETPGSQCAPPPHRPPGGLWGLGEARQMVFVCWGKRLSSRNKGKQESLLWESTYVPGPGKSRPGPWGQWMGYEGYGRSCSLDLPPAAQGIPSLCLFTLSYQLP